MSFFDLEVLKKELIKFKGIMPHLKLSNNMLLGQKNWKQIKIVTHMDLWKYGQNLTIQKSLIIKSLRFIILYYIIYLVPITKLKCESIPFCDVPFRWLIHIFWLQKSITINKLVFYQ